MVNIGTVLAAIISDNEEITFVRPQKDASSATDLLSSSLSTLPLGDGPVTTLNHSVETLADFMGGKHTIVLGGPFFTSSARALHDIIIPDNIGSLDAIEIKFCGPSGDSQSYQESPNGNTPSGAPQIFVSNSGGDTFYSETFNGVNTTNYGFILYFTFGGKHLIYAAGINEQMTRACEFVIDNAATYFLGMDGAAFIITSTYAGQGNFTPTLGNTSATPVSSSPEMFDRGFVFDGEGTGAKVSYPIGRALSGNYMYLFGNQAPHGAILDISSPATPTVAAKYSHGQGGAFFHSPQAIKIQGNYAYLISQSGMEIINITTPANPTHAGYFAELDVESAWSSTPALDVSGNYAFITGGNATPDLFIVDVSNVAAPTQVGRVTDGAGGAVLQTATQIKKSGNYLYIIASASLEIMNATTPATPTHVSNTPISGAVNVHISGSYAYVSTQNSMEIYDISVPASPAFVSSIANGVGGVQLITPVDAVKVGNFLYVVSFGDYSPGSASFNIFNVATPAAPTLVSQLVAADGLLEFCSSIFVSGNYAFVTRYDIDNVLQIIDITDSNNPAPLSTFVNSSTLLDIDTTTTLDSFAVSGNYAYFPAGNSANALHVINISDPDNPDAVARLLHGDAGTVIVSPTSTAVSGNYAYVTNYYYPDQGSLEIIDITNPLAPVHAANIDGSGTAFLTSPWSVQVVGNYAYVLNHDRNFTTSGGLEIVDVSNPFVPVHAGKILFDGAGVPQMYSPTSMALTPSFAYIIDQGTFEVVDISNPTNPQHVTFFTNGGASGAELNGASSICINGNYLYLTNSNGNSIEIIDITVPIAPVHAGRLTHGDGGVELRNPQHIAISGGVLFVSGGLPSLRGYLQSFDITTPTAPVSTDILIGGAGAAILAGSPFTASGNYVYFKDYHPFEVIDVSAVI